MRTLIAASLTGLAVGILFIAATLAPSGADAQSTGIKRAAPPAKAHGKSAVRTPSSWVPNPAVNGKDAYLVSHGNDYAIAHDLKDGREIWRLGGLNSKERYNATLRFVASPVCTPDLIVVPTARAAAPYFAAAPTTELVS